MTIKDGQLNAGSACKAHTPLNGLIKDVELFPEKQNRQDQSNILR